MSEADEKEFLSPEAYGRSLRGFGINLLVRQIGPALAFQKSVLGTRLVHRTADFAILEHGGQQWMLHADSTYAGHPLAALTGDGTLRGAGVELRLYGLDPDAAEARARAAGAVILAESRDKPHGLRECYLADPDGYVWVPSLPLSQDRGQP